MSMAQPYAQPTLCPACDCESRWRCLLSRLPSGGVSWYYSTVVSATNCVTVTYFGPMQDVYHRAKNNIIFSSVVSTIAMAGWRK